MIKESSYKARRRRTGGSDRYGTFRDGKQLTSDIIAGHPLWSLKEKKESN